jgi:hypothetical protein
MTRCAAPPSAAPGMAAPLRLHGWGDLVWRQGAAGWAAPAILWMCRGMPAIHCLHKLVSGNAQRAVRAPVVKYVRVDHEVVRVCDGAQGAVEARFTVALPARGRSILGQWAAQILCQNLPRCAARPRRMLARARALGDAHTSRLFEPFHCLLPITGPPKPYSRPSSRDRAVALAAALPRRRRRRAPAHAARPEQRRALAGTCARGCSTRRWTRGPWRHMWSAWRCAAALLFTIGCCYPGSQAEFMV